MDHRHLTSVYSEYESIDNNSFNSKQLEYWLKQISSPDETKKIGDLGWSFVSHKSSSFQPEEISFAKHQTSQSHRKDAHQDIDKQNNSLDINKCSHEGWVRSKRQKSKSYLNAMTALQKRIKALEQQNFHLSENLKKINEERNRSLSESRVIQEQLRSKLELLEPQTTKLPQLIEENKKNRQQKEHNNRKLIKYQKNMQQLKTKTEDLEKINQTIQSELNSLKNKLQDERKQKQSYEKQIKKLIQKNKQLKQIKDQSTSSLLQKYNQSVELIENYQKDNSKLKNQLGHIKKKQKEENCKIHEQYQREIKRIEVELQTLKQKCGLKESLISQKKQQTDYFKGLYQKKDQEFLQYIKNQNATHSKHQQQINNLKQEIVASKKREIKSKKKERMKIGKIVLKSATMEEDQDEESVGRENRFEAISDNRHIKEQSMSQISLPQANVAVCDKQSFNGFESESQEQKQASNFDKIQTKSLNRAYHERKKNKISVLSSSSRKKRTNIGQNSAVIVNPIPKIPLKSNPKVKQSKSRQNNQHNDKEEFKVTPKQKINKSKQNSKDYHSHKVNHGSTIVCEQPKTQQQNRITFETGQFQSDHHHDDKFVNSYLYSAPYSQPGVYGQRNPPEETNQSFNCCSQKHYQNGIQNFDQVLLIELQKQLLQLYDEQENLIHASNDQYANQVDRSQFFGRLKQINEQLKVKNHKICEIKARL